MCCVMPVARCATSTAVLSEVGLFLWKSHSPAPHCGTIACVAFHTVESEFRC